MSAIDRRTLEDIAVDMVIGSMMYIGTPEDEIRRRLEQVTDEELVAFIVDD